jgi:DNA-binding CsgD family transcriptional regulator/tetratricopeptide (TPR) repeat protein
MRQLLDSSALDPTEGSAVLATGEMADLDPLAVGAELLIALDILQNHHALVVIVVDDLHWIDSQSAQALLFAFRRMQRDRILGLVSTRPAQLGRLGEGWNSSMVGDHRFGRIYLEGLSQPDVVRLAREMGLSDLSNQAVARLREHTGGSPVHCCALLEELDATTLNRMDSELPAPRAFSSIVLQRIASLTQEAQELAVAAAVLGLHCPTALAAAVSGLDKWVDPLDALVESGLVSEDGGRSTRNLRFWHSLVQRAIYDDLAPARRRALHRTAATLTAGATSLRHRIDAADAPDDDLAHDLERAATQAEAEHAPQQAVVWMISAADAFVESVNRERLVLDAFRLAFNIGELATAFTLTERLDGFDNSPRKSALLGHHALVTGQFALAESLLSDAWNTAEDSTQANYRAEAANSLALCLLLVGRSEDAAIWGHRALETVENDLALERFSRNLLSLNLVLSGRGEEAAALLEDLAETPSDVPVDRTSALVFRGNQRLFQDDLVGAHRDLSVARLRHLSGLSFNFDSYSLTYLVDVEYRAGAWDEALVHGEFAVSRAHDADRIWDYPFVHAHAALVPAARGDWSVAQMHVDTAWAWSDGFGVAITMAMAATARASMLAAQEDWEGVLGAVAPIRSIGQLSSLGRPGVYNWRPFEIAALIALEQWNEAARLLEEFRSALPTGSHRTSEMEYWRLQGQLSDARGVDPEADAAFSRAQELATVVTGPLPLAMLDLAAGRYLLRRGQRDGAIAALRAAHNRFSALKAAPFLAMCDADLLSIGAEAPLVDPTSSFGLTPTELVVARLVADGASNREVATELYVSIKAIEFHLSNIFDKLHIRSRRHIAEKIGNRM